MVGEAWALRKLMHVSHRHNHLVIPLASFRRRCCNGIGNQKFFRATIMMCTTRDRQFESCIHIILGYEEGH